MGCGCSAMAAAAGGGGRTGPGRRVPVEPVPPSPPRDLYPSAGHAGILGEVSAGQAGSAAAAARGSGGPCPAAVPVAGGGCCHRALASAEAAGPQRLLRVLNRHRGEAPRRPPSPPAPPVVPLFPPPGPTQWTGPAAAPAPPGGSDARRRPVLPARRQWRPGRRSPGRRSPCTPPALRGAR